MQRIEGSENPIQLKSQNIIGDVRTERVTHRK